MLCEDVFRQITLSKGEAVSYVPATQSDFMGFLPEHPLLNWDMVGLNHPPICCTNINTHKHILFCIHSALGFILSPPVL